MAGRVRPIAAFAVIALLAMGFMAWKAKHRSPTADAASARAGQSAPASPATGSATQPDAAAAPLAQGDPSVRANLLLESQLISGGSLDVEAVSKALSPEHVEETIRAMAAASQGSPGLVARNAAMRDTMAQALAGIDADAEITVLECSERLCMMDVRPGPGGEDVGVYGRLHDALGDRYGEIRVSFLMPASSGDGMRYRNFFTLGSGLRSVRGSAP